MQSVLLISHGSQSPKTKREIESLIKKLKEESKISIFEYAFLELEKPSIPEGIDMCIQKGATAIVILLNFLNSGKHVDVDIPRIVGEAKKKYPHILFKITKPVGQHDRIVDVFLDLLTFVELKKYHVE